MYKADHLSNDATGKWHKKNPAMPLQYRGGKARFLKLSGTALFPAGFDCGKHWALRALQPAMHAPQGLAEHQDARGVPGQPHQKRATLSMRSLQQPGGVSSDSTMRMCGSLLAAAAVESIALPSTASASRRLSAFAVLWPAQMDAQCTAAS